MIVIKIQGGLGNQLFQYALGKSLEKRNDEKVYFDISSYKTPENTGATPRNLELIHFNIADFETIESIHDILNHGLMSKMGRLLERDFLPYYKQFYVKEKNPGFDSHIPNIKKNAYLDGYWQSPKYFSNVISELKEALTLKNDAKSDFRDYKVLIDNAQNSLSVHIRRSDYIEKYKQTYFQLPLGYYNQSIRYIQKIHPDIEIFVFSDDIQWCRENLPLDLPLHFVEFQESSPCEELLLMSQCKHNIIANSTFSWWAAWLNTNPDKMVIAPKKWFIFEDTHFRNSLYLDTWISL